MTAWQPGDPAANAPARVLPQHEPLDPSIEREPPAEPGLRQRAEAGALLVAALAEARLDARQALVEACKLEFTTKAPRLFRTLARTTPDANSRRNNWKPARPRGSRTPPARPSPPHRDWLAWYRRCVAPPGVDAPESWISERIEYRFSVRTGSGETQRVFTAPLHEGGAIDRYTFDHGPGQRLDVDGDVLSDSTRTLRMMASPLRYAGMPSDRLWQFEDGAVNLGKLEVQRYDLARLCFVEFR